MNGYFGTGERSGRIDVAARAISGKRSNRKSDMKQSLVWLVIAPFALQSPVLAQEKTADQAADKVCVADWHASETPAQIKDREVLCGEDTAPGAEKQKGAMAMLCEADDRSYLVATANPSATMTRQGPETAIARLNPRFAARLASAIREARGSGLRSAGIFSAYRPSAFGVGRFLDRFRSLHAYGLAVDMFGIGEADSKEAKLWYEIAGRHGIFCPYGVDSKREWNHCQATPIKAVCPDSPLRNTVTAEGPIQLKEMFEAGDWFVDNSPPATCLAVAVNRPAEPDAITPHVTPAALAAASARSDRRHPVEARNAAGDAATRASKHLHEARNVAGDAVTGGRRRSDDDLMRMVTADLRLGESRPKTRRR